MNAETKPTILVFPGIPFSIPLNPHELAEKLKVPHAMEDYYLKIASTKTRESIEGKLQVFKDLDLFTEIADGGVGIEIRSPIKPLTILYKLKNGKTVPVLSSLPLSFAAQFNDLTEEQAAAITFSIIYGRTNFHGDGWYDRADELGELNFATWVYPSTKRVSEVVFPESSLDNIKFLFKYRS